RGVDMPLGSIQQEIADAYDGLARMAAAARYGREHYLDGRTAEAPAGGLFRRVTALTAAQPWAVGGVGEGAWDGLQPDRAAALALRLATATRPGTVRFALADPVGQGQYLSAFLRLPAQLRVGGGIAAGPAEIENLLATLSGQVVEVTQTRLTNVYDSVEAYNAGTTGSAVPYHVLVLVGFPAGVNDRAAELLGRLARHGPRAGLYVIATADPRQQMPRS